jgi:hypothetical protein
VDLHQRVDQLLADAFALGRRVQLDGQLRHDRLSLDPLHHVEGAADHVLLRAHRQHIGHARGRIGQRPQQARLAQHIVGARRQRRPRRPAQHHLLVAALDQVGHVGMPLADRAGHDLAFAQAVLIQEARQRLEHQQGRATVVLPLCKGLHDVVRCDRRAHA